MARHYYILFHKVQKYIFHIIDLLLIPHHLLLPKLLPPFSQKPACFFEKAAGFWNLLLVLF
jgi:hypothetical protein